MDFAGERSPSFVLSLFQLYGAPLFLLIDRHGTVHGRDKRPELAILLNLLGEALPNRVPQTLMPIIEAHLADESSALEGTIALIDYDVVVGVPSMEKNVDIFPVWVWRIARKNLLASAKDRYRLTDRELQLLELIVNGMPSAEIAEKLAITKTTVEWHSKRLLLKTGSPNRTAMTARILGWLTETDS